MSAPSLPSFGLSLDHFNFQTICKWWLGLNQPLAAEKCSLCYVNTTPKATHNLACKNGGDLIKRHNKLRFIFHIAQQCGSNPAELRNKQLLVLRLKFCACPDLSRLDWCFDFGICPGESCSHFPFERERDDGGDFQFEQQCGH